MPMRQDRGLPCPQRSRLYRSKQAVVLIRTILPKEK